MIRSIFISILLVFATSAMAQLGNGEITVDGIIRRFVTYIPPGLVPADKLPVIISLHGRLGNGKQMMSFADFRSLADRDKFIIVCPDGINKSWNDGRPTPAQKKGIDDVKFISRLIDYIINTYNGDVSRVYVTGMSNGGFMCSRLACELNNRIAAIAVVGAAMDENVDYHPGKPIPVMYIQGTKDPLVPYGGGTMKGAGGDIFGHEQLLKLWADADQCDHKPSTTNLPDEAHDGTSVTGEEYLNPNTGVKVIGYTINNGGHTWPGGTQYLPKFLIGPVSHNLNTCRVIWEFFKGYRIVQ